MKQCTDTIIMVRPANFGFNVETAENNAFQINDTSWSIDEIKNEAKREFDQLAQRIEQAGVEVIIFDDTDQPIKTDAVFPNNWFSTHETGQIITYPMYSPIRRMERRTDIIDFLKEQYNVRSSLDYAHHENEQNIVESTGSMILDRVNKIIYACISQRSNPELLNIIAKDLGYDLLAFTAKDENDIDYYHTNVIMTLGEKVAVICLESIVDNDERIKVVDALTSTGKIILDISRDQVAKFCGNMIQLKSGSGQNIMVMSESSHKNLTQSQIEIIKSNCTIVYSPLPIIEKYGGGSARCMIAEVFLSKK